ncbi:hypothetical protein D3C85_878000 [compost metagenome]
MSITFNNYDYTYDGSEDVDFKFPDEVKEVSFSYDGGRVSVYINGEQVFYTTLGGNDCCVTLTNDPLKNQV